ncbi:AbgT family transporter [Shewanella sp. SNU WT4]|uniref:AbgT family transporter n=1 Tax=Shewanella sp. SNU WT4 TaxID=2590015 RepID=UPI00112C2C3F|nr:AbgT family transporter [Shewanella sp. SNU WT4]QDF66563.1 AbgT family transporter [Shewanella sp. SNU WT4]
MSVIIPNTSPSSRGFIDIVERAGNALPNITMLFVYALILCMLLSLGLSYLQFDYVHPLSGEAVIVNNMFTPQRLIDFTLALVNNFVNYPPLGMTIVATLGIGIAEGSGYVNVLIKKMLKLTPMSLLTPSLVLIGVISHVVSDSAYVILMPVAAMMFYVSGRHPLAGIAAAFAGLAGGFTASFTPSIIDPVMQSFTQDAARIIDVNYHVNVLCNYFVSLGGTVGVIGVCWYITDKIVEPRLKQMWPVNCEIDTSDVDAKLSAKEHQAFVKASLWLLGFGALIFALAYPADSLLRAPDGSLTSPQAALMQAIVPIILVVFSLPGLVYGYAVGKFNNANDVTQAMERVVKTLIGFIVFAFFSAQFLYAFKVSNIGTLIAVSGADFLKMLDMPAGFTVVGIILLTAVLNFVITSASSKWAILAPIFVPMLMAVGISPELTQAAFRISDSAINVSTPMFAFYPLIIMYCQRYVKDTGVGTIVGMMLPYSVGLLIVLTATLFLFWGLDIPLGFNSGYTYPASN